MQPLPWGLLIEMKFTSTIYIHRFTIPVTILNQTYPVQTTYIIIKNYEEVVKPYLK